MQPQIYNKLHSTVLLAVNYAFGFVSWLVRLVLAWQYKGKGKIVPPIANPLLLKSATRLAQEIREGKIKSEDVVRAYVERIQEVEPYINSTVECVFEDALMKAKEADAIIASGTYTETQLAEDKPFLGVPLTVKVFLTVKGLLCTAGSAFHKDFRANKDSPCVSLLQDAGAIVIATTNCPECVLHLETSNLLHGRTNNPYNTSRTSGGSSGGESALLAAGGSVLGLGNDLAGSIRIPCSFTGLFGHKPSRGLVPNTGTYPEMDSELSSNVYTGPMCRYAVDLQTSMRVLSLNSDIGVQFQKKVDFKKLKIYYMMEMTDIFTSPVEEDITMSIKKVDSDCEQQTAVADLHDVSLTELYLTIAMDYFHVEYGTKATKISIPSMKNINFLALHIIMSSCKDIKHTLTAGKADHVNEKIDFLKYFLGQSSFSLIPLLFMNVLNKYPIYNEAHVPYYREALKTMTKEFEDLLGEDTVLFFPTFPKTATYHNEIITHFPSIGYTAMFNVVGLPSTQCPLGFNKEGLPYGMQIIGGHNKDALTVACAVELEKVFGGWVPPGKAKDL